MRYLTAEEVLVIHSEILDKTGGLHGIRDVGLFASLLEKPKAAFGGKELYRGIFKKAAVYFEALVHYHVFFDGNKRTGVAAAARFLFVNGYELVATNREVESFALKVARQKPSLEAIAAWLKNHSKKTTAKLHPSAK